MEPIGRFDSHAHEKSCTEIVLVNPKAGAGTALRNLPKWKPLLTSHHQIVYGDSPEDTYRLAAQAASECVSRLTIVGGDGTIHHALNGYLSVPGTTTKVAILAGGTANDYVASLRDYALLTKTSNLTVDVGFLQCGNLQKHFFNVAGLGLTAQAAILSRPSPWLPARLRYTIGLLRTLIGHWRHAELSIRLPNQPIQQSHLLTLSVAIGKREGSFPLAPDARLDDGEFNLFTALMLRRRDVCRYLPGLLVGKLPQHDPRIQFSLAKELILHSSTALPFHLDGEIYGNGTLPAHCEIILKQANPIEIELYP